MLDPNLRMKKIVSTTPLGGGGGLATVLLC